MIRGKINRWCLARGYVMFGTVIIDAYRKEEALELVDYCLDDLADCCVCADDYV